MARHQIVPTSTGTYDTQIVRLREAFENSDAVIVGAGAGLATASGYDYAGERFQRYFGDFIEKYHVRDMYTGTWTRFESRAERWGFWSRWAWVNRFSPMPNDTMYELRRLLEGKDWFVLTTNIDHSFQRAGFDKSRLRYTQGELGLFQCCRPCCQETWEAHDALREMILAQGFDIADDGEILNDLSDGAGSISMSIPEELNPICPHCGAGADLNLYWDDRFVRDEGWHKAKDRYDNRLEAHDGKKILYLELGVGFNSPGVIKYPFYNMTMLNPNATYACVNLNDVCYLSDIEDRSIAMDADIRRVIEDLLAGE